MSTRCIQDNKVAEGVYTYLNWSCSLVDKGSLFSSAEFAIRPILKEVIETTKDALYLSPAGTGTIALVFPDPEVCKKREDWSEELLTNGTKYVLFIACHFV